MTLKWGWWGKGPALRVEVNPSPSQQCRNRGRQAPLDDAGFHQRERHCASSFLLRACIRRAHSVSLSRRACYSSMAALMPSFKCCSQLSSESSFS